MVAAIPPDLLARAIRAADVAADDLRTPPPGWSPVAGAPETLKAFAARSGRQPQTVSAAILIGFVPGTVSRRDNGQLSWTVDPERPEICFDDYMAELDGLALPLATVAHRRWYNHARRLAGHADREVPDHWCASYAVLADGFDGDTSEAELTALITAPREALVRAGARIDTLRSGVERTVRLAPLEGDVRAALRAGLRPDAPIPADTFLDLDTGAGRDAPGPQLAARLLSIAEPFRSVAIVDVADAYENAFLVRADALPLSHMRMSRVLARVDRGDLREVRRRIRAYLEGRLMPTVPRWAALGDVHNWMACATRMETLAAEPVPPELRDWLLAHRPEVPRDRGFLRMVERHHDRLRHGATARRRVRADVIADSFDEMLVECESAYAAAKAMDEQSAAAHAAAGDVDDHAYAVRIPEVDARGEETGGAVLMNMRSVRVGHLLERLAAAGTTTPGELDGYVARHRAGGSRADEAFLSSRVAVYVGMESEDGTGPQPARPPAIDAYACGAALRPRYLDDATLARRRRFLARGGMPNARTSAPGVVTGDDRRARRLMLYALSLLGEMVVPTTALHRGMSAGRLLYRMVAMAGVRVTTARQLIDDPERGWTSIPVDGRLRPAFVSIPKLPHAQRMLPRKEKLRAFVLDLPTVRAFKQHRALTIRLDGADPALPGRLRIVPVGGISRMPPECGDGRYAFQVSGRLMDISQLGYCLSFMFMRLVRPHDPRHGSATVRHDEGATLEEVGRDLGTSKARVKGYARRWGGKPSPKAAVKWIAQRDAIDRLGRPGPRRAR